MLLSSILWLLILVKMLYIVSVKKDSNRLAAHGSFLCLCWSSENKHQTGKELFSHERLGIMRKPARILLSWNRIYRLQH
jgi:hypothetical protein